MIAAPQAMALAELLSPYLRAPWRDQEEPDGMILRTARLGRDLVASVVAERRETGWSVYGWTHPSHPDLQPSTLCLRVQTTLDPSSPCANRAARCLLEQLLTVVLSEELPAGRAWWSQIDLIRIEDIDGLHRALSARIQGKVKARTLPDLLAELGQTLH